MGAGGRAGLTIVGQVAGSFFGPIGSAVGGMLGAALGSKLWPEQIEGPQLGEFQMMTSTYGAAIPLIWGGMRVGGNVFWCSPIREVEVTEEVGKGGGAEQTYKKRYADIAVGLCAGEIIGIRKIWNNQKLVYDLGDDADIGTIYASFSQGGEGMRFYPGSATQLPDPVIEVVKGVGNTPAYRGLAYIVFENLELGTSFPNITAEVIRGGAALGPRGLFYTDSWVPVVTNTPVRLLSVGAEIIARSESNQAFAAGIEGEDGRVVGLELAPPFPTNVPTTDPPSIGQECLLIAPPAATPIYTMELPSANSPLSGLAEVVQGVGEASSIDFGPILSDGDNFLHGLIPCVDNEHVLGVLALADTGEVPTYWILWKFEGGSFTELRRGPVDDDAFVTFRSGGAMCSPSGGVMVYYAGMLESDLRHAWQAQTAGTRDVVLLEIGDDDVLRMIAQIDYPTTNPTGFGTVSIYADSACAWVHASGNLYGFTRAQNLSIDLTLDEVVSDICVLAGLTEDQIDVADLESVEVDGYLFPRQGSARAAIEPLMTFYGFDAVESDDMVKFVLRHSTAAVTIPQDDLGAGNGAAADALVETTRAQESELAMRMSLSYVAPHADYQVGTQVVTRGSTESQLSVAINVAIAASDEKAIEALYRMMYEAWTARNQRSWATTVKYSAYEPTDVVDLEVA